MTPRFHSLFIKRIEPLTADAAAITFAVPPDLRDDYAFSPGQFLTLRAMLPSSDGGAGEMLRRSYSICSTPDVFERHQELQVGIKRVAGGRFSTFTLDVLRAGDEMEVMTPDGRFVSSARGDGYTLCVAAGSGITPLLSLMAHGLATTAGGYTLIYGNQKSASVMFHEALHNLKDRYPTRLSIAHVFSRQMSDMPLMHGRLDAPKLRALLPQLVPLALLKEAFVCGPEGVIEATQTVLTELGVAHEQVHSERFLSSTGSSSAIKSGAALALSTAQNGQNTLKTIALSVTLDGKTHELSMAPDEAILDAALDAGLDLPYSCKGGVCSTCRAKLTAGRVHMDKHFTLEKAELDAGFVLTCQSKPLSDAVAVSLDER